MAFKALAVLSCFYIQVVFCIVAPQNKPCPTINVKLYPPDVMGVQWIACYHTDCIGLTLQNCLKQKLAARRDGNKELRLEFLEKYMDASQGIDNEVNKDIGDIKLKDDESCELKLDKQKDFPGNLKFYEFDKKEKFMISYSCLPMPGNLRQMCEWVLALDCNTIDKDFMEKKLNKSIVEFGFSMDNFLKTDWEECM